MREDNIAVLLTKRLSIRAAKMGWERAFAGLNGSVRTGFEIERPTLAKINCARMGHPPKPRKSTGPEPTAQPKRDQPGHPAAHN
jgi:hypothetical protein